MPSVSVEDTTSESELTNVRTPLQATDRVFITIGSTTYKGTLANVLAFIDSNIDLSAYATISSVDTALSDKCPLVGGLVPSGNLPSFVDDTLEYANLAAFPVTGESGKIYIALDANLIYRWTGSTYVLIGDGTSVDVVSVGANAFVRYDIAQTLTDADKGRFLANVGLGENSNLGVLSSAQKMTFFDDFLNVEYTKSLAGGTSGVDEIPVATISEAALNWIGGIRVFDASSGGYYRANCPNKTATTLFNFLEQNNTIDFATEIYIPTTAEAPATSGSYFVGIVADHPSIVGLTGAVALVVWDVNSANWRLRLANGTFVDTGIAAAKGTKFKIDIKQASDTVLVKINGTTVITATANSISETAVLPCCGFAHAGAAVKYEIWQDYHGLKLTLNSTRTNFGFS